MDNLGNSFAAGYAAGSGTFDFGGLSVPFSGGFVNNYNTVLVKYDADGIAQWSRPVKNPSSLSYFQGVCVSGTGTVFVVGNANGSGAYDFGGDAASAFTGAPNFGNTIIVKYR